jgi:hypothetical protein
LATESGGTVKVPVVGPEKKSTVMLFGVAGVGVIIYAIMAKKKAAAAAAAASSASPVSAAFTDPAGNQCAAPDASTGYCPGTPEDISAQEQLSGSGSYGMGSGYGSSVSSLGGQSINNAVPVFTNNGAWGTYVEQMLGSNGSDSIAAAVAKYLAGASLTTDQATVAEEAIAIANYPPVSGPGGFPPSMNTSGGTAQQGTCPSGYTWVQTATGAAGEQAATGGAGWCLAPIVTQTSPGSCPAGHTYSATQTGKAGETPATGGPGFCEPAPVQPGPTPTPAHPQNQSGTVHSDTTGENASVSTTDGGMVWTYNGPSARTQAGKQTGTVHSATTGQSAKVTSTDGGYVWNYAG